MHLISSNIKGQRKLSRTEILTINSLWEAKSSQRNKFYREWAPMEPPGRPAEMSTSCRGRECSREPEREHWQERRTAQRKEEGGLGVSSGSLGDGIFSFKRQEKQVYSNLMASNLGEQAKDKMPSAPVKRHRERQAQDEQRAFSSIPLLKQKGESPVPNPTG